VDAENTLFLRYFNASERSIERFWDAGPVLTECPATALGMDGRPGCAAQSAESTSSARPRSTPAAGGPTRLSHVRGSSPGNGDDSAPGSEDGRRVGRYRREALAWWWSGRGKWMDSERRTVFAESRGAPWRWSMRCASS
jgi:hypothetical protein